MRQRLEALLSRNKDSSGKWHHLSGWHEERNSSTTLSARMGVAMRKVRIFRARLIFQYRLLSRADEVNEWRNVRYWGQSRHSAAVSWPTSGLTVMVILGARDSRSSL